MDLIWIIIYIIFSTIILIIIKEFLNNIGIGKFLTIIIMVASVILELIIGLIIYNNQKISNVLYSQIPNICPDYWEDKNDYCLIPNNKKNIGTLDKTKYSLIPGYDSNVNAINFNDEKWLYYSTDTLCLKKKWANWANINNIKWDGITNVEYKDKC
jgi:predicted membrane channel-forming protein YqfA (hemolysin III family)